MNKKTRKQRIAAVVLSVLMSVQCTSMEAVAQAARSFAGNTLDKTLSAEAALSTFDRLYSAEELVQGIDFSSRRLLVGTGDSSVFTRDTNVISGYNGVYLLEFDSEPEAISAYTYYYDKADFVEPDISLTLADSSCSDEAADADRDGGDALSRLRGLKNNEELADLPHFNVALIDTGVREGEAEAVSVIDGDAYDDNGHGTAMLEAVRSVSPKLSVLSVKAFDGSGSATLSSVYAAMVYAASLDVDVIVLPFAAESISGSALLERFAAAAQAEGIIVVGAAGNNSADASGCIPGNISGIYIAGACDKAGERLPDSNYGSSVFCNVYAGDTTEAAAKLSAVIAAYGVDGVFSAEAEGIAFENTYEDPDDPEEYEAADETELEAQVVALSGDEIAAVSGGEETAAAEETDRSTAGSVSISEVIVKWLTESETEEADADRSSLELVPTEKKLSNQQFQINFTLSGQSSYEPGAIKITIPSYIWYNSSGERYGDLTLSVPQHPGSGSDFEWEDMGDHIVITNIKKIAAASTIMLQGTFRNMLATEMTDGAESEPFRAEVTVQTSEGVASLTSNSITASVDTMVKVTDVEKSAYNYIKGKYDVFWDGAPAEMPSELLGDPGSSSYIDPDEYVFVRWYIAGAAGGSQKFRLYAEDTISPLDADLGAVMLGASHLIDGEGNLQSSNGVYYCKSEDGRYVKALMYDGYDTLTKTAYVWTAYKKDSFSEDKEDELHNNVTIRAVGYDYDETNEITLDAIDSGTLPEDVIAKTKYPTEYKFVKYWDEEGYDPSRRPDKLQVNIYRTDENGKVLWRTVTISANDEVKEGEYAEGKYEGNTWEYTWSDEGVLSDFDVTERLIGIHEGRYLERYNERYHYIHWFYELLDPQEFDEETNTWLFTNVYIERWEDETLSLVKKVNSDSKFTESRRVSKTDGLSLNKLLKGETVTVPYTINATISQARRYMDGIKGHTFMLEDTTYGFTGYDEGNTDNMAIGSVTLNSVAAYKYIIDPDKDPDTDENGSAMYPSSSVDVTEPTVLWGNFKKTADEPDNWIRAAQYIKGTWTITAESPYKSRISISEEGKVLFEDGVYGIRLATDSEEAYLTYSCEVEIVVKPSEQVIGWINDSIADRENAVSSDETYFMYNLVNNAEIYTRYIGDDESISKDITQEDRTDCTSYLHGRPFKVAADMTKTFEMPETATDYDKTNSRVQLHSTLQLTQQSNIPYDERSDYLNALADGDIVNSASGTFYDLLPYGAEPDFSSFKLTAGVKAINPMIVRNYKGTGRTLLIIQAEFEDNVSYSYPYVVNPADPSQNQPGRYNEDKAIYNKENSYPVEGWRNSHIVEFDSYISYDDIFRDGTNKNVFKDIANVAAYEADEDEIGNVINWIGEPDDPRTGNNILSDKLCGYLGQTEQSQGVYVDELDNMTGLDSNRRDPSFVYAVSALKTTEIDRSQAGELEKKVQASGSAVWSTGRMETPDSANVVRVNVSEGGLYTYKLSATARIGTTLSDIVFLDYLEAYVPGSTEGDTEGVGDNRWRGTLLSVDLTSPEAKGIDPVVYYCTAPVSDVESEVEAYYKQGGTKFVEYLIESPRWTTDLSDLSEATAIAVDLRATAEGEAFTLNEYENLTVLLEMKAPYEDTDAPSYFVDMNGVPTSGNEPDENAHAYNNTHVICMKSNEKGASASEDHLVSTYTKVGISARSVAVEKIWEDDNDRDGLRPEEIMVTLHNENSGEDVQTITLTADDDWKGEFSRVPVYDDNGNPIVYSYREEFANQDQYTRSVSRSTVDGKLTIYLTNTHDPERITIPVTKLWDDGDDEANARPSAIRVSVYADDDTQPTATITIRPDKDGSWYGEFTDLFKYKPRKQLITYTVVEEAVEDYRFDGMTYNNAEKITDGVNISNKYYPYGDLIVGKTTENTTSVSDDREFTFTLLMWAENGSETRSISTKYAYTIYESNGDNDPIIIEAADVLNGKGNGDSFTLKGGQYIVISDIDTHIDSDGKRWNICYSVTEAEDISGFELTEELGSSGRIISWEPAYAEFTNTYSASGSAKIEVMKDLDRRGLSQYQFEFALYDESGERIRTAYNGSDGKVTFGALSFTEEDADKAQPFKYYIKEIPPTDYSGGFVSGYQYDTKRIDVDVYVYDNGNGTMRSVIVYLLDGKVICVSGLDPENEEDEALISFTNTYGDFDFESSEPPEFNNVYRASGSIVLKAWKDIDGGDVDETTLFDFELFRYNDDDGTFTNVDSVKNNGDGVITFSGPEYLSFTQDDAGETYWFFAREVEDQTDEIYIYDKRVIGYKVTVVDNGDGTLSFDQSAYDMTSRFGVCAQCGGAGSDCEKCDGFGLAVGGELTAPENTYLPKFINGMEDGSLSISKKIAGTEDLDSDVSEAVNAQEFTFTVKLIGDKVGNIESPIAYTITQDGKEDIFQTAEIANGTFTIRLKAGQTASFEKNIPAGTQYQIVETSVKDWVLSKQENAAGTITPKRDAEAEFTNEYVPGAVSAVIVGSKYFDNKLADPAKNGETFWFELVENGKVIETVSASAGGLIQFSALTYTKFGTHEYEVREVAGGNGDIIYDRVVRRVTVKVDTVTNASGEAELQSQILYYDADGEVSDEMRFDNYSAPGSLTIGKTSFGANNTSNNPLFAFKLTLTNANGMPLTGGSVGYIIKGADGKYYDKNDTKRENPLNVAPEAEEAPKVQEAPEVEETQKVSEVTAAEPKEVLKRVIITAMTAAEPVGISFNFGETAAAALKGEPMAIANEVQGESVADGTSGGVTWEIIKTGGKVTLPSNGNEVDEYVLVLSPTNGVEGTLGENESPWRSSTYKTQITSIQISGGKIKTAQGGNTNLFEGLTNLVEADITGMDASETEKGLGAMFKNCKNLVNVTLGGMRASKTISLYEMFADCTYLENIDGIDVLLEDHLGSVAISLDSVFRNCENLGPTLNLSKWNTEGTTSITTMFYGCKKLETIEGLEQFNTDSLKYMDRPFAYSGIKGSLDLTGWNVSNVINISQIFYGCASIEHLDLSGWKFTSLTSYNVANSFYECKSLKTIDLSDWDIGKSNSIQSMFGYDTQLEYINMSNWTVSPSLTNAIMLFDSLSSLTTLDVSGWSGLSTDQITSANYLFYGCRSLKELTIDSVFYSAIKSDTTFATYLIPGYIDANTTDPNYSGLWVDKETPLGNGLSAAALADVLKGEVGKTTYIWQKATYSITFNDGANGNVNGSIPNDIAHCGEQYVVDNKYERPGYVFAGWDDGNGNIFGTDIIPAGTYPNGTKVTLTALWEPEDSENLLTIEFTYHLQDIDDETSYTGTTYPFKVSNKATSATIDPEAILGEILAGYVPKDEAHRSVTIEIENGVPKLDGVDLSFYYDRIRYTVIFDPGDAPGERYEQKMVANVPAVLENKFAWSGHAFISWKTEDGRTYDAFSPESIEGMGSGDTITLYAQWFSVTEETIDSTIGELIVYCYGGETIIFTSLPAGTQYTIEEIEIPAGWTLTGSDGTEDAVISNKTNSASFVNTYSAAGSAGVEAHKLLEGAVLQPGMFSFVLNTNPNGADRFFTEAVEPGAPDADGNRDDTFGYEGAIGLSIEITASDAADDGTIALYDRSGKLIKEFTSEELNKPIVINAADTNSVRIAAHNADYSAEITAEYQIVDTAFNGNTDSSETKREITASGEETVANPWYGLGIVSFEPIDYTKPGEYIYYIWEVVDQSDNTIEYDKHRETVKVIVTDDDRGRLIPEIVYSGSYEYADGESAYGAVFRNRMKPGTLTIAKILENPLGNVADKQFTFKITLTDLNDNPLTGEYQVEVKPDGSAAGDETLILDEYGVGYLFIKGGQSFTISGLPDGAGYTIEEADLNEHFTLKDCEGGTGSISASAASEAVFTNVYDKAEGEVALEVNKNFIGGDLSANQFSFTLYQGNDPIGHAYTDESGHAAFTAIDFDLSQFTQLPARFRYTIREDLPDPNNGALPDIRYDEHEVTVTVTVDNDADGDLVFDVNYDYKNSADYNGAPANRFNNLALFDLEVTKTVTGSFTEKNREFDFTLTLSNDDYGLTDGITYTKGSESGEVTLINGRYTFKLKHGERIVFSRIPYGTAYTITEDGVDEREFIVTAAVSGVEYDSNEVSGSITQRVSAAYVNECVIPSAVLPSTGGSGTRAICTAGAVLVLSASAALEIKRRRQKKQRSASS